MFKTKWGTFTFKHIPFGLIKVGATFQRSMHIMFHGLIGQTIVVYLDDVTNFSKKISDQFHHLRPIFEWCRRYGIYLNLKKRIFGESEGNLLGHIIANVGIKVDPKWVDTIF